jgi:DNA replication and repair protein RecF
MPDDSDTALLERPAIASSHTIAVRSLALTGFRNYAQLRLEPDAASVILTGPNGAGKTNILEAVSLLAPGRGMRRAKLAEMDCKTPSPFQGEGQGEGPIPGRERENKKGWVIAAQVDTPQGEAQIGTARDTAEGETDKRLVRIDGRTLRSHNELAPYVAVVWLTPQMDQLFQEGQSARRKFLDRLVYGFDAEHASRINAFEYVMRERNRLLSERRGDAQWLASLESKMAERSVAIAAARMQTVAHLNEEMRRSARTRRAYRAGDGGGAGAGPTRGCRERPQQPGRA